MTARAWINALALSIPLWVAIVFALAGCGAPAIDTPPPALPGVVDNIRFATPAQQQALCHPNSPWSHACMLSASGQIVMPLPQYYPGDEYARLWSWELAHRQLHWPDPPDVAARLRADDAEGAP